MHEGAGHRLRIWFNASSRIDRELPELLKPRMFDIACGYKDANDLDSSRRDPLLPLRLPSQRTPCYSSSR